MNGFFSSSAGGGGGGTSRPFKAAPACSITGRDPYLSAATHCWKAKLLVVRPDTLDSRSPGQ